MSDVEQIRALVHSYALVLDRGDVDGVVALFAHATWRSSGDGPPLRGSAEVRPVYENLMRRDGNDRTKHLLTNLSIDVRPGSLTASSHCYWTVLQRTPDARIDITLSGQYGDTFEKADGTWRFTDRLITVDLSADSRA